MELYIQVRNGQPFGHPIVAENFRQAFPHIDTNNLPPEFAGFTRVSAPSTAELPTGPYEVRVCTYTLIGDSYADVWSKRQLTEIEKTTKQDAIKTEWPLSERGKHFGSWVFNAETCWFEPPVAKPTDGKEHYWSEAKVAWQEVTPVVALP